MKFFLRITEILGFVLILSLIAFCALYKGGETGIAFIMLGICIATICTWVLCFFSRESGMELPSSPFALVLDHPYEVITQWNEGGNQYAIFKPLIILGEEHKNTEEYCLRFINLGCALALPSKFVIPTIAGGSFAFQPYERSQHMDTQFYFKEFGTPERTAVS